MTSKEILLTVDKVSKKYCKNLSLSLKYGFMDSIRIAFGAKNDSEILRTKEFWALRNISFSLARGDRLGVLGKNGAGKSTLMKLIAGIVPPSSGRVRTVGKVDQMIELTSGFHPMMTGYQNVKFRAQMKGISGNDLSKKIEQIIEFSDLKDFIHTPIKYYSSGMRARLGFAVSTMAKPDILIIDEALAVGDLDFRLKCYEFISNYQRDTALIFVSHSLPHIKRICNIGMVLEQGKIKYYGDTQDAIDIYQGSSRIPNNIKGLNASALSFDLNCFSKTDTNDVPVIHMGENISIDIQPHTLPRECLISINISDNSGRAVLECRNDSIKEINALRRLKCEIGPLYLSSGNYRINISVHAMDGHSLIAYTPWKFFQVKSKVTSMAPFHPPGKWLNV